MRPMDWAGMADLIDKVGGTLIALAAVAVTALTVYISYRERTKAIREHLYEQRVKGAIELAALAGRVIPVVWESRRLVDVDDKLEEVIVKLWMAQLKWSAVLSERAVKAAVTFIRSVGEDMDAPRNAMERAYRDLMIALRDDIGADRLGAETLRLIGDRGRTAAGDSWYPLGEPEPGESRSPQAPSQRS
jgi:hypothetical protein